MMDRNMARRESIPWCVMAAVYGARPLPVKESLILQALQKAHLQCTEMDLGRVLYSLEDRKLVILKQPEGTWRTVELTNRGVDMIERAWEECRVGGRAPEGKA